MRLVLLETPYKASSAEQMKLHLRYARACMRDCLKRGEAPFASHLLYTQEHVLDDNEPAERALGIKAGLRWGERADATVVYTDLGISTGMKIGIEHAEEMERPVDYRMLPGWEYARAT